MSVLNYSTATSLRSVFVLTRGIVLYNMGKSRGGFYAVRRGHKVGVFMTWDECKANVDKYGGARYKKFATEEEAWQFVNEKNEYEQSASKAKTHGMQDAPSSSYMSLSTKPYEYNATMAAHTPSTADSGEFGKRKSGYNTASTSKKRKYEKKTSAMQQQFTNDRAVVYTDGACAYNGQTGGKARAGIGVYWGDDHPDNVSERLQGRQTNQRAEIMAATVALEKGRSKGLSKISLLTDSKYTINCVTSWMDKWKQNGWKTVNNKDVMNKKDLERLDSVCQDIDVEWKYVPGHSNIKGNEKADKLATSGAKLQYHTTRRKGYDDEYDDDDDSDY